MLIDTIAHMPDSATIHAVKELVIPVVESKFPIIGTVIGLAIAVLEVIPQFIPTVNSWSPFRLVVALLDGLFPDKKVGGGIH